MITRRACLRGAAGLFGAAMASKIRPAFAEPAMKKAAVVSIFFEGGFNALFGSPDSFAGGGAFGVTSSNMKDLGNGLFVDSATIGTLGDWALKHMAAIGNRHGATDHVSAQQNNFVDGAAGGRSYPAALAAAMGGGASFKAVAVGSLPTKSPSSSTEAGVSLQLLRTMEDVTTALGVGPRDPNRPEREAAAKALSRSKEMSQKSLTQNARSMSFARDAYDTVVDSLGKAPPQIDVAKIAQSYGSNGAASLDSVASKLAAAELMIRAGTNVVTLGSTGWDTHGDRTGATVRRRMTAEVMPALKTFLARLQSEADLASMNISVILHGDFARSLPSSDHAAALTALVIGPNVKVGTTGKVGSSVTLPATTGGSKEMWSYLAALTKINAPPFGANPHGLVL